MKKNFWFFGIAAVLLLVFACVSVGSADRGGFIMRPVTLKENIDLYDAGQKAVICWKDGEELMVLSTDKYVSQDAKVLEFLPLPSKPSRVEKADTEVFDGVARLIESHRPRVTRHSANDRGESKGRSLAAKAECEPAVKIVFHKKIGAHDITIARVDRFNGFAGWVKKFMINEGMQYRSEDLRALNPVVASYMSRGYRYFVFDVIELTTEKKSISPILYQFKSRDLYFPLIVTTLSKGETNIALYLFTQFKTDVWGTATGFVSGFYALGGRVNYDYPVKFTVSPGEMAVTSKEIANFMGADREVWFSTAKYKGLTTDLKKDFILKAPRN